MLWNELVFDFRRDKSETLFKDVPIDCRQNTGLIHETDRLVVLDIIAVNVS